MEKKTLKFYMRLVFHAKLKTNQLKFFFKLLCYSEKMEYSLVRTRVQLYKQLKIRQFLPRDEKSMLRAIDRIH